MIYTFNLVKWLRSYRIRTTNWILVWMLKSHLSSFSIRVCVRFFSNSHFSFSYAVLSRTAYLRCEYRRNGDFFFFFFFSSARLLQLNKLDITWDFRYKYVKRMGEKYTVLCVWKYWRRRIKTTTTSSFGHAYHFSCK